MHTDTIIVAVIGVIAVTTQAVIHYRERKDLYSRIMAGNLREYHEAVKDTQPSKTAKGNPIKRTLDKQYDLRER